MFNYCAMAIAVRPLRPVLASCSTYADLLQGTFAAIDAGYGSLILHQYWLDSPAADQEDFVAFAAHKKAQHAHLALHQSSTKSFIPPPHPKGFTINEATLMYVRTTCHFNYF